MAGFQAVETGYSQSFTVSASDAVADPNGPFDKIYCAGAGNATLLLEGNPSTNVFTGLLAGFVYPFRVTRVNAGALTATLIGLKA